MSDEEINEVVSALKANDKTMKDSGISDNLWGKAVECITFLQFENAELKSSLTHANEECLKWYERTQNLLKDSIGSISGYEKKISDLQAKNADLREKFATLNKMPCNIGDTVYVLFGSCYRCEDDEGDHCSCEKRGKDKIFEIKVGSVRFDKDDYYIYEDPIGITSGLSCSGRNYGKTWFLSMEEAKNHLMKSYDDMIQHA